ncbi:PREDICTED: auxin-responsive protein IAA9-like isoform X1 [Lupinus angustifolius]|uniref:auxin-responsive protein IAA9-like isoform X1 n=1 Tax=Lupinus angustifolius TaxID=3871 RepID=UPI00092F0A03|nr:PREDICTED: auxin-responsive protein IAA9-like isoform X1 [Lupinus angustifolius]XP_019456587.1 PREDICTED: auxin-responsive protein IAA9-like isoform X1 [Lupinus angustifolius]XP_019456588.1 PREDICTED: auxin-responsive protein IAA9-like isoform X1 [Lupinus angustifolius]XP_019456590.1 PREDICTED: auxin-responsive protein IAA9-like isoform X1 [Lupinus angustifolius]XP_019456591.1 PREDICTED: auxin-responsive protein IAA9-like isoform X1 [Lupinus angustifolius]
MSPPQLGIGDDEGESNVTLLVSSSTTMESVCLNGSKLKEFNYMGLSDSSSVDSSVPSFSSPDENKSNLNLKATELRLGLPGSQSPERDSDLCLRSSTQFDEKPLFPLRPAVDDHHPSSKPAVLGNKRGFSDAMNEFPEGKLIVSSDANTILSSRPSLGVGLKPCSMLDNVGAQQAKAKEVATTKATESRPIPNGSANNNSSAPATKAQVVGWPPIRSFRKNSLATTSKNIVEVDGKVGSGTLFVKVSMDGAPYLRKVDLKNYSEYPELSSALEKMFTCFTIGRCGSHGNLNETKLKDQLHGSEYVLSYEDKDGDWMLVGDVPWEMFIDTCRRLRIMKTSDAIGLAAPRAFEKK